LSTYAPSSKEHQYERPTSRHPFYDVQDDLVRHVLLVNEPEHVHKNFRTPLSYTRRRLAYYLGRKTGTVKVPPSQTYIRSSERGAG